MTTDAIVGDTLAQRFERGVVLVGYRGTGKSTVGRILADRLGRQFVDADAAFEARAGCSIARYFRERGEQAFREEEEAILEGLSTIKGLVLATGGGVVNRERNRERLRQMGLVVWLTAAPGILAARIAADAGQVRPALTAAGLLGEIEDVVAQRMPLYASVADLTIGTGERPPTEVAALIQSLAGAGAR
jgi:shikimate kinase